MTRTDIIKCHPEWLNDNTIGAISDIDRLRVHVAICRQDVAHFDALVAHFATLADGLAVSIARGYAYDCNRALDGVDLPQMFLSGWYPPA
jgi:hypothetical protein